jgi:hypothetical protein
MSWLINLLCYLQSESKQTRISIYVVMQSIFYYCPILNTITTYGQVSLDRLIVKFHDNFNLFSIFYLQRNIPEE